MAFNADSEWIILNVREKREQNVNNIYAEIIIHVQTNTTVIRSRSLWLII